MCQVVLGNEIILVGYSGHGFVVAEAALTSNLTLKGYTEFRELGVNPFKLDYLGFEGDNAFNYWDENVSYILGIGENKIRKKIAHLILSKNKKLINVIHPSASISSKITIGDGNFIARNVSINALVAIGDYCILNTGCIIEHECIINNGVHIGPGAVLAGNVIVGSDSFIGANAVVKQGVSIGNNVVVGAGSVVIRNILDNKIVAGNPAKEIV